MSNTINYTIPTIGSTPDPTWESYVNTALTAISTHTHDGSNAGALLPPASVTFASSGFNFNNQPQTNASYFDVAQQSALPAQTAGHGRITCDTSGNLYYVSPSANVLLASATAINYSSAAKGFVGSDYGSTGGAAFYNAASGTWPVTSCFFLYSATATPTNDNGTRASVGLAQIDMKGSLPKITVTDTSGATLEVQQWGTIASSSGYGGYGLKVKGLVAGGLSLGSYYSPAFMCYETLASQSVTEISSGALKTYGFHVNGSPPDGTASNIWAHSVRVTVLGNTSPAEGSYWAALSSTGTAVQAPAAGFGYRHRFKATFQAGSGAYTDLADQAMLESYWQTGIAVSSKVSGFRWFCSTGSVSATPVFDGAWNTAGTGMCIGLGVAADPSASKIKLGLAMDANSHAVSGIAGLTVASGGLTVTSGGATITGNSTITGTLIVTSSVAFTGGNLDVTGSMTSTAAAAATSFLPTATSSTPSATYGGVYKNNQILACGVVTTGGVVSGFNLASASWASNVCTVTLSQSITGGITVATVDGTDSTNPGYAQAKQTAGTTVVVTTMRAPPAANPSAVAYDFSFVIFGAP